MLENNSKGFERVEIERTIGNRITNFSDNHKEAQRLHRHQKAPPWWIAIKRRTGDLATRLGVTVFITKKKGRRAGEYRSEKKKIENSGDSAVNKKSGGRGKCYVCGKEEHFAHKHCGLCKSFKPRTLDCEERGVAKGAMLANMNVPTPMAAMVGEACGHSKEKWESDSGATSTCLILVPEWQLTRRRRRGRWSVSPLGPWCQ